MAVVNSIYYAVPVLILVAFFSTKVVGKHTDGYRMCIPATAEPSLNSSSCYPLVNFTRPFCQNLGVALPSHVYRTPSYQNWKNDEGNKIMDAAENIGISKISQVFAVDVTTIRKCLEVFIIYLCHDFFPSCDRTQSTFMERKICRESCLKMTRICGKMNDVVSRYYTTENPEYKKKFSCELQPYRNAGDSPECYYLNGFTASKLGTSLSREWDTNADCLYLNGSSYYGNISMTASGTPCQAWTEQCPHRHTMNKTYPELNNAENHCRNPQNSGKRPLCFTTDRKKRWEYCDIPKCRPVDGSYGNWSLNNTCSATCGKGFERSSRECNSPKPKYGGKNCSNLGKSIEYRLCSGRPCPVNGGYGINWTLIIPCNVSCGDGVETWQRACGNPVPKYGGRNCSKLGIGISTEIRNCSRAACPIDGDYGNWTKSSPCSATCGQGVAIWTRQCDNPPGKYGGNCSSRGSAQENRVCEMKPCPAQMNYQTIGITVAAVSFVIFVSCFIFFFRRQRQKRGSLYYALLNILPRNSRAPQDQEVENISEELSVNSSQGSGNGIAYENLTNEGNPIPGFSRGVVPYRRDYVNTRPAGKSWYDGLLLIRPLAMEWLRNAWGNTDHSGRNAYDVLQHDQFAISPYSKLPKTITQDDCLYSRMERPEAVLRSTCESPSTGENVEVL